MDPPENGVVGGGDELDVLGDGLGVPGDGLGDGSDDGLGCGPGLDGGGELTVTRDDDGTTVAGLLLGGGLRW